MGFRDGAMRRPVRLQAAIFLAACLLLLMPGSFPKAQVTEAANPNRIVVSTRATIAAVDVPFSTSRSYRGATEAPERDRLAEFSSIAETPDEFAALLALPGVSAGLGAESIIGPDDRVRVTPTATFPARATVLVTFAAGRCSGWLIGPDTVVTAGHCVHPGGGGSFYPRGSYRVYPGRNGAASRYGSCTAKWLASVTGWTISGSDEYDYAAIKLNCTVGNTTGWYGFFWQSGTLTGLPTTVNGYPGDRPLTQWRSSDRVRQTQVRRVFYKNDTVGGVSGSPVWYNRSGCGLCAMAVHAYGVPGAPPFNNHGTRITQGVFNNLVAWRDAP